MSNWTKFFLRALQKHPVTTPNDLMLFACAIPDISDFNSDIIMQSGFKTLLRSTDMLDAVSTTSFKTLSLISKTKVTNFKGLSFSAKVRWISFLIVDSCNMNCLLFYVAGKKLEIIECLN